jgi:hypothetical protein
LSSSSKLLGTIPFSCPATYASCMWWLSHLFPPLLESYVDSYLAITCPCGGGLPGRSGS